MKRIAYSTLVALALAGTSGLLYSCKDYLDVKPDSYYTPEDIFSSVSTATSAVLGAYDPMSGDQGYGIRLNLYFPFDTDEALSSPGGADAGRRGIARYAAIPTNSEISRPWDNLYLGIERCNICIRYVPQMTQYNAGGTDQAAVRRLHGEALVLRAQYYHELIRNWGDVPAPYEPSQAGQDFKVAKTDRNEIYDKLLADLAQAIELLPWRTEANSTDERITKGAAKALRARIALARGGYYIDDVNGQSVRAADYQQYYQIARDECSQLMARREQHTLLPNADDVWRAINELRLENIEILFQVGSGGGSAASDSKLGYYNGPRLNNSPRYGTSSGAVQALPTWFYAYDSTDTRRDLNVTKYTIENNDQQKATDITKMTDGKFRRDWRVPLLPGTAQNLGYNWPIIRFADVLLMYAEAENELNGPNATAKAAYEEVRRRAFKTASIGTTPSDKAGFFNAIVQERLRELGGESIRKYDLIRWNLLGTKIADTKATLNRVLNGGATGLYANVPQYMYYQVVNGQVNFLNSFYRPSPATAPVPVGGGTVTRINWKQALTASFINGIATSYEPNKGKELLPIPQTAIDTNPNLRQNFGY